VKILLPAFVEILEDLKFCQEFTLLSEHFTEILESYSIFVSKTTAIEHFKIIKKSYALFLKCQMLEAYFLNFEPTKELVFDIQE
jgi:hypothetical protein